MKLLEMRSFERGVEGKISESKHSAEMYVVIDWMTTDV